MVEPVVRRDIVRQYVVDMDQDGEQRRLSIRRLDGAARRAGGGNRMMTSTTLQTNDIWSKTIGHDPHAGDAEAAKADEIIASEESLGLQSQFFETGPRFSLQLRGRALALVLRDELHRGRQRGRRRAGRRGVARGVFDGSLRVLVKPELVALGVAGLAAPAPRRATLLTQQPQLISIRSGFCSVAISAARSIDSEVAP